jgi:hypothetical protein
MMIVQSETSTTHTQSEQQVSDTSTTVFQQCSSSPGCQGTELTKSRVSAPSILQNNTLSYNILKKHENNPTVIKYYFG